MGDDDDGGIARGAAHDLSRSVGEPAPDAAAAGLKYSVEIVLVVDVVESVLSMERDEERAVARWLSCLKSARKAVEEHCGSVVRTTGDGLVATFDNVPTAANAAFAIHQRKAHENADHPDRPIVLRAAIDRCRVVQADGELYGRGINRTFRLLSLAKPGRTVVTSAARDELVATVDADIEDLGPCFVRHVPEPVRVYAVGPVLEARLDEPMIDSEALSPVIAFLPPTPRQGTRWPRAGMVLCEESVARLSRSAELRVISRMSTSAVAGRDWSLARIGETLGANYVVSGSFHATDAAMAVRLELADVASGRVLWNERLKFAPEQLVTGDDDTLDALVAEIVRAVRQREVQRVRSSPLASLEHYSLMMGAITLMHRMSPQDFEEARRALDALLDRASRQALPLAWLGRWHVLRVQQGWSDDPKRDGRMAVEATERALQIDPGCTLALVTDGQVRTNLLHLLDEAEESFDRAIEVSPSDPQAWLLRGTMHAFRGDGARAVVETDRALDLSPLDPHRFFFEGLAAAANLAAQDWERAETLARSSLRLNRTHTSTLRALGIAQWQLGKRDEARRVGKALHRLDPKLTVTNYLRQHPAAAYDTGKLWAETLECIGIPK